MYQFAWAKEVLNYLSDNQGLVDLLELAFADLREAQSGLPNERIIDEGIAPGYYLWRIHDHAILIRRGIEGNQPKLWIEAIKPIDPDL